MILLSVLISAVTIFLSAWFPAGKAAKISAIEAIRLTNEIKIKPKKVKTSPLMLKLFNIEGMLAAKTLKRNKSKYRATIISLVISIILFMGGMTFGNLLLKSANFMYMDYGINVVVRLISQDNSLNAVVSEKMRELPATNMIMIKTAGLHSDGIANFLNTKTKYNDVLGKDSGINSFMFKEGISIPVMTDSNSGRIELILQDSINEMTAEIAPVFKSNHMNVILPENALKILGSEVNLITAISVMTPEPDQFTEEAEQILKENLPEQDYYLMNVDRMARLNRNLSTLMMIFVYSFIGLLSIIAVTNVLGTISTGVALRKHEFAMFSSIGMTKKQQNKMTANESFFYAVKALLIGIPIGLAVSYLLHNALAMSLEFPFTIPWNSILISIIAVLLISFGTMAYSVRKTKIDNIVESLRNVNI